MSVTTADDFLGGRITVIQPKSGHRAGSDAVFLAAAVPARKGELVLDAGSGVGVAGLCLLARVPGIEVTAVEIDAKLCALATKNAARNGCDEKFRIVNADVTSPGKALRAAGLASESYNHVLANPPFHAEGKVRAAPHRGRAVAHVMGEDALSAWMHFFAATTAPKGLLTLIHRPESLGELLHLLEGRFGDIAVFPLFPKDGAAAVRIIVQGRKGSRAGLGLLPGLVLHHADGSYTAEAEAVLRGGEGLDLGRSNKRKGRRLGGKGGSPLSPEREEPSRAGKVR
ncbi:MAG TPA: methyltransferase [Methyloceanibacter sp.]|jgi:tRNA1(Val) A37 N6-methylase TrmN6|nr:methyltransferase [Methyloceanibacter sp.]